MWKHTDNRLKTGMKTFKARETHHYISQENILCLSMCVQAAT